MENNTDTKIYTQDDVDNITAKVKETLKTKMEKTHISLDAYRELENKYNSLVEQNKISAFREVFKVNGGNIAAYDDFIASNKEVLGLEGDALNNKLAELKEAKPYFFENKQVEPTPNTTKFDSNKEIDSLLDSSSDLVEGTLYKNIKI